MLYIYYDKATMSVVSPTWLCFIGKFTAFPDDNSPYARLFVDVVTNCAKFTKRRR